MGPPPHTANLPEKIGDIVINALVIGSDANTRLSHEELSMDGIGHLFSKPCFGDARSICRDSRKL